MQVQAQAFQSLVRGKPTDLYLLRNNRGLEVAVTNYGARFVSILVPHAGGLVDVVVGFDSLEGYLTSTETYYSALVGRFANRIARGQLKVGGRSYQLSVNLPPHHLHGGPEGFGNQVWDVVEVSEGSIEFSYFSRDGEENFPGNLAVTVRYSLDDSGALHIDYKATTDSETVINLTSHPYFNLNGQGSGSIENHILQVNASNFTPVDITLIPTGIEPVQGTAFDFREPQKIGSRINNDDLQLIYGGGYDHNFVLDGTGYRSAARATGDITGIELEVLTDQPGMQLYTGNFMSGDNRIKGGVYDHRREGFCLETQHFPDSPNQPDFPSTLLQPGEVYQTRTSYRFKTG